MSKAAIVQAITERLVMEINYSGEARRVEPHLLGINKTGTLTLSAWQLTGKSGIGWRAYSVAKIDSMQITEDRFMSTRPDYNPNDSTMAEIICRC